MCLRATPNTNSNCTDIDECALGTDLCDEGSNCTNTNGAYTCSCDEGYEWDGLNCTNIDECLIGADLCDDEGSICTDTDGSYTCSCDGGYEGDGSSCVDIDECDLGTDLCDVGSTCTNTNGAYTCSCDEGLEWGGSSCVDIDECALGTDSCDVGSTCTNTNGAYTCSCDEGLEWGGSSCVDIDECALGTDSCDVGSTCTNTNGAYTCSCDEGLEWDGSSCVDIDECALGTDSCDVGSTCTNTHGAYTCSCDEGLEWDGSSCVDIDECASGTDSCDVGSTCTNTNGAYTCSCDEGLEWGGSSCVDIDECALGTDSCNVGSTCTNTNGAYTCSCDEGLEWGGSSCVDIDECALGTDSCDVGSTCTNTNGAYTCSCDEGLEWGGSSCVDIDECALGTDLCDEGSTCTNTNGAYSCSCDEGLEWGGFYCTSADETANNDTTTEVAGTTGAEITTEAASTTDAGTTEVAGTTDAGTTEVAGTTDVGTTEAIGTIDTGTTETAGTTDAGTTEATGTTGADTTEVAGSNDTATTEVAGTNGTATTEVAGTTDAATTTVVPVSTTGSGANSSQISGGSIASILNGLFSLPIDSVISGTKAHLDTGIDPNSKAFPGSGTDNEKCVKYSALSFADYWCKDSLNRWNSAINSSFALQHVLPTYSSIVTDSMSESEAKEALINAVVDYFAEILCRRTVYLDSTDGSAAPYASYVACVRDVMTDANNCDEANASTKLMLDNLIGKAEFACNSDGTTKTVVREAMAYVYPFFYHNGSDLTALVQQKGVELQACFEDLETLNNQYEECIPDIYSSGEIFSIAALGQSASDSIPKNSRAFKRMASCLENVVLPDSGSTTFTTECKSFGVSLKKYLALAYPVQYGFESQEDLENTAYTPRSIERRTLWCFGDPHCKFYDPDESQDSDWITCSAPGNQVWLRNALFTLNMTTSEVSGSTGDPKPTIMTGFHIAFRSSLGAYMGSYSASGGVLPTAFDGSGSDLLTAAGEDGSDEVINVVDAQSRTLPDVNYVLIQGVQHGFLASFVKRNDSYPVVVLRISKSLLDVSSGMFITGCPEDQIIGNSEKRRRRRKRQTSCVDACSGEGDRQSNCEFDCDTVGPEYAQAASSAAVVIEQEAVEEDSTLVDPVEWANQNNNGGTDVTACVILMAVTLLIHLY
ncbi:unnamed protein product [Owenia fusiformis]|uniref:EGF-like domain-containing protein n=1 Tax=Owenia fusiformis TaxID=6347 RepID=A0A8S4Q506_OWEFU|nr:unnamed protein product [Owenia fusiformis]